MAIQYGLLPGFKQSLRLVSRSGQSTKLHWTLRRLGDDPEIVWKTFGDRSISPKAHSVQRSNMYTISVVLDLQAESTQVTCAHRPHSRPLFHCALLIAAYFVVAAGGHVIKLQFPDKGVLSE
uniref:AlNc14C218G9061 protein n=1 Tax=Albugo laibachii Nc14 TaxID=890382 RepID=F0WRR5_9STRA|nr:AlNc14C218G9061 [Albugo laibachii Nc14]|eukprot:CCA24030.1 AlNc14C218G9061 [Albugo laibachii Nc14]